MAKETPAAKQLRIKLGMAQRLQKELAHYKADLVNQENKIRDMEAAGADPYDVKKQREVLAETEMMLPDTDKRLSAAIDALQDLVDAAEASDEDAGPKLEEAQAFLEALSGEGGAAGASAPAEDEEDI